MKALAKWYVLSETLDRERPEDMLLAVALERYEEQHGKHVASADAVKRAIRIAKAFFGSGSIASLNGDRQAAFELHLRDKGFADAYIGRIQTVIKAAVNRAYKNGEIASAPPIRVVTGSAERGTIAMSQVAALFNADPPPHVFMAAMMILNTLSRPGAVLECRPVQADFASRLLDLNPPGRKQTKKRRPIVPITNTLLPWLQARADQTFFVQWHEGQTKATGSIKNAWRKLCKRAGVTCDPYTLRHAMATDLRRRGVPEWEVQGMLGHRSAGTTERYAKFAPDYLGKAATAIDDYFHELQPLVRIELVTNVVPLPRVPSVSLGK